MSLIEVAQVLLPALAQVTLIRREPSSMTTNTEMRVMGREAVVAVTNGQLDGSTEGFDRAFRPSSAEGLTPRTSPKSLAPGRGSFEARRNRWPVSLDGRRRKRVLVKIIGE